LTEKFTLGHAESRKPSTTQMRNISPKRNFHLQIKIDPAHARDGLDYMLSRIGEFKKSAA
jgi:hypothetical protein